MSLKIPKVVWFYFFIGWNGLWAATGRCEVLIQAKDERTGALIDAPKITVRAFTKFRGETLEIPSSKPGNFHVSLPEFPWTRVEVEVVHERYEYERLRWWAGHSPDRLVLALKPGLKVGGRVLNRRGEACSHARVLVGPARKRSSLHWIGFEARHVEAAGAGGYWSCSHFPESMESVEIRIQCQGYAETLFRVEENFSTNQPRSGVSKRRFMQGDAVFFMDDPIPVLGRVRGPDGSPVEGVQVRAGSHVTWTPSDGSFKFDSLPQGNQAWIFQAHGFAALKKDIQVHSNMKPLDIRLGTIDPVTIRVVDPQGKPLPGVFVSSRVWGDVEIEGWCWQTDAQGRVTWDSPPDEARSFDFHHREFKESEAVVVRPGEMSEVVLSPLSQLNLKLVDAESGLPVTHGEVFVGHRHEDAIHWTMAKSWDGQSGNVSIPVRDPKLNKWIRIAADRYQEFTMSLSGDEEKAEQRVELIPLKVFRGRVVDANHQPIGGARAISINPGGFVHLNGDEWEGGGSIGASRSDEDGRFEIQVTSQTAHLAVMHESGFALSENRAWAEASELQLQPWGGVACRMELGLLGRKGMVLGLQSMPDFPTRLHPHAYHKLVRGSESVEFDRVPPGVFRLGVLDQSGWIRFNLIRVDPGKTTQSVMKAGGAALKGEVSIEGQPMDGTYFMGHLMPAQFKVENLEAHIAANPVSFLSGAFQYRLEFVSRAEFQADHVFQGEYELEIHCHKRPEQGEGPELCRGIFRTAVQIGGQDEIDLGTLFFKK